MPHPTTEPESKEYLITETYHCFTVLAKEINTAVIMLLSSLNRACRDKYQVERSQVVAKAFVEKSHLIHLYNHVNQRNFSLKFAEAIDVEMLKYAITLRNPFLSLGVAHHLQVVSSLPTMLCPDVILTARSLLIDWEKAQLRDNGLFGYYILLLQVRSDMDSSLYHNGRLCDRVLRQLLCLKIIYDLHKPAHEIPCRALLLKAKKNQETDDPDLPSLSLVSWGNSGPNRENFSAAIANLLYIDASKNLAFNQIYFAQVTQSILRFIDVKYIKSEHKVSSLYRYQLGLFKSAVHELQNNEILSAEEGQAVLSENQVPDWI